MQDSYSQRRSEIGAYFDRTAAETWKRLTSDAPVGRIRATVRAGRDEMRNVLLSYLPEDLAGARVLDAGCGTGAMAQELALRGASVVAIDLSKQLIDTAEQRLPRYLAKQITFKTGDMTSAEHGMFDFCVAMDSIIHYERDDMLASLARLANITREAMAFTFAPRTPALAVMHNVGKLFPRSNRSPAIVPQAPDSLNRALVSVTSMRPNRTKRVSSGFYISQALELVRA
jgi:magnesium-protoporphyrin O-methyltransferase